jgi:hypothetical protein
MKESKVSSTLEKVDENMGQTFSLKQVKTVVLLTMLAGLSMGNESCQKANDRVLKMDVDLGTIGAQAVLMPSGEKIDFGYVANSLFYQSVMANDHFVISNAIPTPKSTLVNNMAASKATLAQKITSGLLGSGLSNDEKVLQQYGFLGQLQSKAVNLANITAKAGSFNGNASDMPACLYDLPQAKLAGEVVSFETTFGAGLSIGYGTGGALSSTATVGGTANFTSTRLQMGLRAVDPLNNLLMASATGVSSQSDVKFGVNLAAALLGLDFFYKTPIASVVTSAIDKSLSTVVSDLIKQKSLTGSWGDTWESRVVYDPEVANGDTQIIMRGGSRYGMMVGDQFTVTNMRYKWAADPCTSALQYKVPMSATPVANVTVIAVGDNVAVAKVDQYLIEDRILPGAQVKLLKMYVAPSSK